MGESEVNVHALLFADRVITEHNGKRGIIGSFNRFSFRSIPGTSPPWFVFIVMDNLTEGAHELTINIVRRGSSEVVFSGGIQFGVADTAKGVDITVPIPPLVFPREGTYVVSLTLDSGDLRDRLLEVQVVPAKEA